MQTDMFVTTRLCSESSCDKCKSMSNVDGSTLILCCEKHECDTLNLHFSDRKSLYCRIYVWVRVHD